MRLPTIYRLRLARTTALLSVLVALAGCGRSRPWNVVLFTFDTTRADFIGCYGKENARTPNLDKMAAEGYLFEHNYTSNPVTQAAHSTILTGVYPMVHGVRDNTFFHLPDSQQTLAELLSAEGYATAAAIGGFPLTKEFGTAQGFDLYDDDLTADRRDHRGRPVQRTRRTWYDERPAGHVNDAILPWLRETATKGDKPFFFWLHYWDPHEPHIAPPPYGQLFAHEPYSGEIAYADENLGTILRELEKLGELDRTLIVMTSDHGEGRLEHNEMTHAFLAYDPTIRVPLILQVPGRAGGVRVSERVGTVDIVPTVLDLLGFDLPDHLQGRSLGPLTREQSEPGEEAPANRRDYYSESMSPRLSHGVGELRVLFRGPYKYIHGPRSELFNLDDDPAELNDLSAAMARETEQLEGALQSFVTAHASASAADAAHEASEETRRQLAALGYLSTTGENPDAIVEKLRTDGEAPQDRVTDINLASQLRNHLGSGDFRLAKTLAERLVKEAPNHAFYRAKLAAANLGLGLLDEAARVVEETEKVTAANVDDYLQVASALFADDQRERGLAMAERLVDTAENARGRLVLAELYREAGDGAAFEKELARALELEPENLPARLTRAEHLTETEAFEEAGKELKDLLGSYPAFAAGHLAYGRLLQKSGRKEEAVDRLARTITLAPGFCDAHLERLQILVELERADSADKALKSMRRSCRDREALASAAEAVKTGDQG